MSPATPALQVTPSYVPMIFGAILPIYISGQNVHWSEGATAWTINTTGTLAIASSVIRVISPVVAVWALALAPNGTGTITITDPNGASAVLTVVP